MCAIYKLNNETMVSKHPIDKKGKDRCECQ